MCVSKWPTRQVPKILEEAEKRTQNTQSEKENPAIDVSPKSPCGAITLGRRRSYEPNTKIGPRDEETQKFASFACVT